MRTNPSRFAPGTTASYAALWLVVVAVGWSGRIDADPVDWLAHPESSARRMTVRDFELALAIDRGSALERAVLGRLYGRPEETLLAGIEIQRDALQRVEQEGLSGDVIRVRLGVLLTEANQPREAAATLSEVPGSAPLVDDLTAIAAGRIDPRQGAGLRERFAAAGLEGEILEWLERRAALAGNDPERAAEIDASILARGNRAKRRALAMQAANLAPVLVGALLCVAFRRRTQNPAAGASPWTLEDGIGVFVRGDFFGRLILVGLSLAWTYPLSAQVLDSAVGELLSSWATLFASLPMLWLIHRHLLAPGGRSVREAFGLDHRIAALRRAAGIGLGALAIDLVGTHAVGWTAFGLGLGSSWAEGFDEALVFGSPATVALTSIDYLLWTPAFEELAFRGLFFFSLRHRLGPLAAAVVTAVLFAGLHFYSLPGFLMTFWSGLVWALAFERAGSLLPGIGAHAVYNGLYVAGLLLAYR